MAPCRAVVVGLLVRCLARPTVAFTGAGLRRRQHLPAAATRLASAVRGEPDRPPTLPSGAFRPKQSLGQNYLSDQNYVLKITSALRTDEDGDDAAAAAAAGGGGAAATPAAERGARVVELGPGLGALTRVLLREHPAMLAIEIDERAVALLRERHPSLTVLSSDVLQVSRSSVSPSPSPSLGRDAEAPVSHSRARSPPERSTTRSSPRCAAGRCT